jgi:hypothetical protein
MSLTFILGWLFLGSTWLVPKFIKDKENKSIVALVLSSIAFGLFIGNMLSTIKITF